MSNNRVTSITKCKNGYIWIGTDDGINRFDGLNCKYYLPKQDENYFDKLNQQISALYTDLQGNVWIGAYKLFQYNYQFDSIIPYFKDPAAEQPNRIRVFYQSPDNKLWIGARNGLFSIANEDKKITHHKPFKDSAYYEIWDLIVHDRIVWMATKENGLYLYDLKTEKYSQVPLVNEKGNHVKDLLCVFYDPEGQILIGSKNDGVFFLDPQTKKTLHHEVFGPKCRRIRKIAKDRYGNKWIGTNEGLYIQYKGLSKIVKYTDEDDLSSPISQNSVFTIYIDNQENMWLGTFAGGVSFTDMLQKKFVSYFELKNNNVFLNDRIVSSIVCDKKDNIYLGVGTAGLNVFDRGTGIFSFYPLEANAMGGTTIKCLAFDSKNILWIGLYQGRINRFNPETKEFSSLIDKRLFQNIIIESFAIDKNDNVWIGTDQGVEFIKNGSSEIKNIYQNNGACVVYIDQKGEIWTGVSGDGIFWWDEKRKEFISRFQENMFATVNTLYRDGNNHLWVGEKNGLSFINLNNSSYHKCENIGQSQTIQGILEDDHKNLWISTTYGIVKCINAVNNPKNFKVKAYNKADGLPNNYLWKNSAYKSSSGRFYFGSSDGFIEFYPDSIRDNPFIPEVKFVNLKISDQSIAINQKYNGKIILRESLSETKELSLSHKYKPFTIEFAALHYANPNDNQYAYMLYPLEKNWNYTKAGRNFATYYSLPGGKYTLRVKAANSDGLWNETPIELNIRIVPPFWKTIWFLIIVATLVIAILIIIYYQRLYSIQLQREKLEKQVKERTLEISLKNADLETQKVQILKQSKELSDQKQYLEELNSMKDKLLSIIAHDLKNPFNAVLGFSDILTRKYDKLDDGKKLKYIQLIHDSSKNIFGLLENLLIWSRSQIHVLPFNPVKADLHDLITQNIKLCEADYWKKKISVYLNMEPPVQVCCDINMMNSVIRNLLTNAIKFTGNEGTIEISHLKRDRFIEVLVKDNGIGIDEKIIDILFQSGNSFKKKGTFGEEGSGLGLVLCKDFITKHGGKIWVESKKNEGCTFHFTLPENGEMDC